MPPAGDMPEVRANAVAAHRSAPDRPQGASKVPAQDMKGRMTHGLILASLTWGLCLCQRATIGSIHKSSNTKNTGPGSTTEDTNVSQQACHPRGLLLEHTGRNKLPSALAVRTPNTYPAQPHPQTACGSPHGVRACCCSPSIHSDQCSKSAAGKCSRPCSGYKVPRSAALHMFLGLNVNPQPYQTMKPPTQTWAGLPENMLQHWAVPPFPFAREHCSVKAFARVHTKTYCGGTCTLATNPAGGSFQPTCKTLQCHVSKSSVNQNSAQP